MMIFSRSGSGWRWSGMVRAVFGPLFAVAILAGCAGQDTVGGAASPEDAVKTYVDALNSRDEATLRRLAATDATAVDVGIKQRLADFGGRDIRIAKQQIDRGPAPHQASVRLTGQLNPAGTAYSEQLFLNDVDGRWFVSFHDDASPTLSPSLPPAGTQRP